jgi:hypothetical protein
MQMDSWNPHTVLRRLNCTREPSDAKEHPLSLPPLRGRSHSSSSQHPEAAGEPGDGDSTISPAHPPRRRHASPDREMAMRYACAIPLGYVAAAPSQFARQNESQWDEPSSLCAHADARARTGTARAQVEAELIARQTRRRRTR